MNFNLIVDLQLHPISSFIKIEENKFSNLVRENKNNVEYVCYGGLEDYINKTTNEVSYILTNDFFDGIISHDCKQFMKNLLKPTTEFQQFIDYQLSTIPYDTFNIIHYRLNDDDIFFFETKLCHLGLSNDFDGIRDTLFEFFLITNSSKIKTYCIIHIISGFVKWISQIYDIPVSIITK